MIAAEPIGFVNTVLPVALIVVATVGLPNLMVRADSRSQARLGAAIGLTALALVALGAVLFAAAYALRGHPVGTAFAEAPLAATLFFLRLALGAAVVWAPILALTWFVLAQRVEKARGAHVARVGP